MITFVARSKLVASFAFWTSLGVACIVAGFSSATAQSSRPPSVKSASPPGSHRGPPLPSTNADANRKKTDNQRMLDEMQRKSKAVQNRLRQQGLTNVGGTLAKSDPPPFNAAAAPPPDECLKAFVAAGRSATSMDQLMSFLPQREMEVLKSSQSSYDPKQAANNRQWFRQQNPDITDEGLTHITNPPYANALKFNKGLANDIRDILSVKVDGNKAQLVVSTNNGATINDVYYPYGKADVEMVGEGNYWKLSRFHPSIVYYKEPPTTP
jgi:hypothetical protein